MNTAEYVVIIGGVAAIVWVNWYFFVAGRSARPGSGDDQAAPRAAGPERQEP